MRLFRGEKIFCLMAVAAMVFCVAFRKIVDSDTFWHLKVGELLISNPAALTHDIFSFLTSGQPWKYKDISAEIFFYVGTQTLGDSFFFILKALVAVCIGLALWFFEEPKNRQWNQWAVIFCLLMLALAPRFLDRPLLFSFVAFSWLLVFTKPVLSLNGQVKSPELYRAYIPVIILQWGWAFLHRGAVIGFLLISGVILVDVIKSRFQNAFPSFLIWFLVLLVTLLNPSGYALLTTSFEVFWRPELKELISEWRPLTLSNVTETYAGVSLIVLSSLAGQAYYWTRKRTNQNRSWLVWLTCLWAVFLFLGTKTTRWLPYLSIVSAFILVSLLPLLPVRRLVARGLVMALIVLAFKMNPFPFGIGMESSAFPRRALEFASKVELRPRVMNFYDFGGYLIGRWWPRYLVLMDGRADQVYPLSAVAQAVKSQTDETVFDELVKKYNVDWVLASNIPQRVSHLFLKDRPDWQMVLWTEVAVIYVKKEAYPELQSYVLRKLPLFLDSERKISDILNFVAHRPGDLALLQTELERTLQWDPVRIGIWLAIVEDRLGLKEQSQRRMRDIMHRFPDHPLVESLQ